MEMEVMMPSAPVDFNFDSTCTSPYISAPSSPQRFGTFFFSAPTSPTRASSFYADFNNFSLHHDDHETSHDHESLSAVPFNWEEKPGMPKAQESLLIRDVNSNNYADKEFAFDFSGQLESSSLSADELFDGGKIKPLKPPPRLQSAVADSLSPKSPRSPKKKIKEALSPRHKMKDFDPFAAALEQTRKQNISTSTRTAITQERPGRNDDQVQRGRERTQKPPSIRQKGTRSLSPFRVSDLLLDHRENNQQNAKNNSASSFSSSFSWFWYRKWKLKDLLLFRSASEGRAMSKDHLNKYSTLKKNNTEQEDVKNSSFRSTDSVGSSVSSSKRRGQASAHELHYTANRAVSEELRKKTFLPYKQGLLGCLGFNPGIPIHEISKGLGSMSRVRG
ncbi:uncharacterized protein LOC113761515 [Coffea eugenioides]|uniref:uncharacterized protein LOC113761515 n=1 Tax=Coffea eugenioides TaxID=49369 RepID=UPI000F60ABA1|nr:uncharacterized protein LOC113761515 [Coffea eugenioides]